MTGTTHVAVVGSTDAVGAAVAPGKPVVVGRRDVGQEAPQHR